MESTTLHVWNVQRDLGAGLGFSTVVQPTCGLHSDQAIKSNAFAITATLDPMVAHVLLVLQANTRIPEAQTPAPCAQQEPVLQQLLPLHSLPVLHATGAPTPLTLANLPAYRVLQAIILTFMGPLYVCLASQVTGLPRALELVLPVSQARFQMLQELQPSRHALHATQASTHWLHPPCAARVEYVRFGPGLCALCCARWAVQHRSQRLLEPLTKPRSLTTLQHKPWCQVLQTYI